MTVEQGLFKRHFVGRDNFIWWLGQIVDETKWSGNIPGYRTLTTGDHKGFEYRYKVRIMGYHTAVPSELKDDDLPWASVMYPVTAGAGTGGLSQTPNLKQGMFVYGFFLDGEDAQQPIIMGVLGYNQYTQVLNNIPDTGFVPFQGYRFAEETVAKFSTRTEKEPPLGKQSGGPNLIETDPLNREGNTGNVNNAINQSVVGDNALRDAASEQQRREGQKRHSVPVTSVCEKQPLGQIQLDILELVKDIELARKSLTDWTTRVSTSIEDVQRWIEEKIKFVSDKISQGIEWIVTEIEKNTIKKVNDALKNTYFLLLPNERPNLKTAVETANDLLACLFRKIIGSLYGLVSKLLTSLFDKLVNVPSCFSSQFVEVILGSILNDIISGVASILSTISGIVGTAISISGGILEFIADLFSWLTCDTKPKCPEIDSWSPWNGVEKTASFDIQGLVGQVTNFAGNFTDQIGGSSEAIQGAITSIKTNVESSTNGFDISPLGSPCDVGPQRCSPPVADFYGGEGGGAEGNVITGFTGEILSVDIINQGGGYSEPPFVKFKDNCGKGTGAVGRAILEFDPDVKNLSGGSSTNNPSFGGESGKEGCVPVSGLKNGRVVAVVIEEPGKNYLYGYDGSEGGGGRTFANYCETIVRRAGGCYDLPYLSGETINLNAGDWIKYPNSAAVQVTSSQSVTAPKCGDYDSSNPIEPPPQFSVPDPFSPPAPVDDKSYPIDLIIRDVVLLNPGYNYTPGDPIVFVPPDFVPPDEIDEYNPPNNGVDAEVGDVDNNGSIKTIIIRNTGASFTSYPRIYIKSNSGFNAKLAPRFEIRRLTPEEVERKQQAGQKVISVIDCVGKIPPKQEFDIV
jgi:hypothetical protein